MHAYTLFLYVRLRSIYICDAWNCVLMENDCLGQLLTLMTFSLKAIIKNFLNEENEEEEEKGQTVYTIYKTSNFHLNCVCVF